MYNSFINSSNSNITKLNEMFDLINCNIIVNNLKLLY